MANQDFPTCVCRDHERSTFDRPEIFLPIIAIMFVGVGVLFPLADVPSGLQLGSIIPYTAFVALATFSAQRGQQPYFFECPIAVYSKRYMPTSWLISKGDGSPFGVTLWVLGICLAMVQVFTNRSLLERAHSAEQATFSLRSH
jgi:hypothetical protein